MLLPQLMARSRLRAAIAPVALALCPLASAQVTQRVNVSSNGEQANWFSSYSAVSGDGRFVVFETRATNLVPGDTNEGHDVFVRDRRLGTTERVSVSSSGEQMSDHSFAAPLISISADGRIVAFSTRGANLVPGDTNDQFDVFVHDRATAITDRISVSTSGAQGSLGSQGNSTSADGRYVAFASYASELVVSDTNGVADIFVRDRVAGTTDRVSVSSTSAQANAESKHPAISGNGRYVAFATLASNLIAGDANQQYDAYVRDLVAGTTERISFGLGGAEPDAAAYASSISHDGRFVAFSSTATNLVPGDGNGLDDAFLHDRATGTTERVSVSTRGTDANGALFGAPQCWISISADGRYVSFSSAATNLVPGDTNAALDIFVRDRLLGRTERASVDPQSIQADSHSSNALLSAEGRFVVFRSHATNLVSGDTNGESDIFIRDLRPEGFTSSCDPGVGGVPACPCGNPPSGAGRGCDNSSTTGGAVLAAEGAAYLSQDSLRFTTSGERAAALSILTQWNAPYGRGAVFGMGIRCTSGSFERLYSTNAVGGGISVPDLGAGDAPVSVRSAALGDAIQPGESRWYLVHYRDPIVLGGCPATSTFNATQTGKVDWAP